MFHLWAHVWFWWIFLILHSADDFESKFQFHPVEDLPPPDEFKPFPRIYPSKENRGSCTERSLLLTFHWDVWWIYWDDFPLCCSEPQTTRDEDTPQMSQGLTQFFTSCSSCTHIRQLILLLLLMTTAELPRTGSDAGFECVLFVFSAFVCVSVKQGPASYRLCDLWPFQCGMFWMCVRRRDLPTHTRTLRGQCLPPVVFIMTWAFQSLHRRERFDFSSCKDRFTETVVQQQLLYEGKQFRCCVLTFTLMESLVTLHRPQKISWASQANWSRWRLVLKCKKQQQMAP